MNATIQLPKPFSLNNMFANVAGRGRVKSKAYKTWRRNAMNVIMAQGPRPCFTGPVAIRLLIGAVGVSKQIDTDNCTKAYLDTLVNMGIISDDNRTIVVSQYVDWVEGMEGAEMRIQAA